MRMTYDSKKNYTKATFKLNEQGRYEIVSNNQTEDLLIFLFQEQREHTVLLEKKNKYLVYMCVLFCLNLFLLALIFYVLTLFL